jgi:hypothetical protein
MVLLRPLALVLVLLLSPAAGSGASGDDLLAHAVGAPGITQFHVPVHFVASIVSPFAIRSELDGLVSYVAPDRSEFKVTNAPALLSPFFSGVYRLDVVPQVWPARYHVTSVSTTTDNGAPVQLLEAVPTTGNDVTRAVFTIDRDGARAAAWTYADGSSVSMTFVNASVKGHEFPASAVIHVNKPQVRLDADAIYGTYTFDAPSN